MRQLAISVFLFGIVFVVSSCPAEEDEGGESGFRISTVGLERAMVNRPYAYTVSTADGPTSTYTWDVTPVLPSGLVLIPNGTTAQIYGIADTAGSFTFTVTATASVGESAQRQLTLDVDSRLRVVTSGLPCGTRTKNYQQQLEAEGGLAPRTWDLAAGTLPPGLTLNPNGLISGSPSSTGSYVFRARVTDVKQRVCSQVFTATMVASSAALTILPIIPPPLVTARPYRTGLSVSGGTGTGYNWTIQSGALPPGINLTSEGSNGAVLAGVPSAVGSYTFAVEVQDSGTGSDTLNITLDVYSPGTIVAFAGGGAGSTSGIGDGGAASNAVLSEPHGIDRDATGNIYIADTSQNRIRRVDATTGLISTIAGKSTSGYSGDGGAAAQAELWLPHDVAVDRVNDVLYIADYGNQRIRAVDLSTGVISTFAGGGTMGVNEGGQAVHTQLDSPEGLGLDAYGNVYVALRWNLYGNRVRRIDRSTGIITTVAGTGIEGDSGDYGQATSAKLGQPRDVAIDGAGNVYIADSLNKRVRVVNATTGVITPFAGTGVQGFSGDGGQASTALMSNVGSLVFDGAGNLFIADSYNNRIRRVDAATQVITTVAGSGTPGTTGVGGSGDGGQATSATLERPGGVGIDSTGRLLIGDSTNNRVRLVDATGIISTWAGGGMSVTGPLAPTTALLGAPQSICEDDAGNTFIADPVGNFVYKVDGYTGYLDVFAGTGGAGGAGDGGPATSAMLNGPVSVAVDNEGNVYIAEAAGHRIRRVDAMSGVISTFAGTGVAGYSGDGGVANAAQVDTPQAVDVHADGSLLIADYDNYRIRRVDLATRLISTIAGTGMLGTPTSGALAVTTSLTRINTIEVATNGNIYIGDNVARVWTINFASGVISEVQGATPLNVVTLGGLSESESGKLFVADGLGYRVHLLSSAGALSPVAGTGSQGDGGDGGSALAADLDSVYGILADSEGDLLLVSGGRVRRVLSP
ncbi:MAG: putative Ig domain-containing protein [Planctomycetes bacterium]|nr:putative Ig domain-containing protein [Planctomycetota bacterium]